LNLRLTANYIIWKGHLLSPPPSFNKELNFDEFKYGELRMHEVHQHNKKDKYIPVTGREGP
jgi:hypothetical protein